MCHTLGTSNSVLGTLNIVDEIIIFDQTFTLFKIVLANFLARMYGEVARLARRAPSHADSTVDLKIGGPYT